MAQDPPALSLKLFFFRNPRAILFALSLVLIENVAWILEPTVFGDVIDAFIDKSLGALSSEFVVPLSIWIGVFLINSGVGTLRRVIDPRIYLRIYTHMAVGIARVGFERNHSVSRTAARADLIREYIAFFQYRLPEIVEQTISIGGAIIALAFFDVRISLACLLAVIPLAIFTRMVGKKVGQVQESLHDTREEVYDAFSSKSLDRVERYYREMTASEMSIARWTGMGFGIVRVCLLVIFLVVLYISIDIDDFSTGSVFSVVAYIWTFISSTEYLPELLESWTSIKELDSRLADSGSGEREIEPVVEKKREAEEKETMA